MTTTKQPPYGPLKSKLHLLPGDLVRVPADRNPVWVGICQVNETDLMMPDSVSLIHARLGRGGFDAKDLIFVGRPDADGWITAPEGGYPENPVPGRNVEVLVATGRSGAMPSSDILRWNKILRWRLLPEESAAETPKPNESTELDQLRAQVLRLKELVFPVEAELRSQSLQMNELVGVIQRCVERVEELEKSAKVFDPLGYLELETMVEGVSVRAHPVRPKIDDDDRLDLIGSRGPDVVSMNMSTPGAVRCAYDVAAENVRNAHKALIDAIANARALDLRVIHNGSYVDYDPSAPLILRTA